jgi:CBS domain-containing protein
MQKIQGSRVSCAMSTNPVTVRPSTTMKEAAALMVRRKLNRLVVEEDGLLLGIISSTDVVKLALCEDGADDCVTK